MKLYRSGGLLLLVVTLCQLTQTLYSLGLFAGGTMGSRGLQFLLFGDLCRLWIEGSYAFRLIYLLSAAYSGLVMVFLMGCALVVLRGQQLWLGAKFFMLITLLFLFSDHLYYGAMSRSFSRVPPEFFPNWYLLETIFYLLFMSIILIVFSTPGGFAESFWRWKLFSFRGRISRSTIWLYYVAGLGVFSGYCYLIADLALHSYFDLFGSLILAAHIYSVALWPSIALVTKRCHDRNHSGWFQLLMLVPLVNLYCWVNIFFLRGTEGPNRFNTDSEGDEMKQASVIDPHH